MASDGCPLVMACTNRCMPHAGQLSPVRSFTGHLGQNQKSLGLNLYSASPAATAIAVSKIIVSFLRLHLLHNLSKSCEEI